MFGINSFEQIKEIAEGWTNYALGREKELSESRMKICRECSLYNEKTDRCDSKRCYNKETGELKTYPEKGFICGCGCVLHAKSRLINAKCPMLKWK